MIETPRWTYKRYWERPILHSTKVGTLTEADIIPWEWPSLFSEQTMHRIVDEVFQSIPSCIEPQELHFLTVVAFRMSRNHGLDVSNESVANIGVSAATHGQFLLEGQHIPHPECVRPGGLQRPVPMRVFGIVTACLGGNAMPTRLG